MVWKDIGKLNGPTILIGDFNMVESRTDRFQGLGYSLQGKKCNEWYSPLSTFALIDILEIEDLLVMINIMVLASELLDLIGFIFLIKC